MKSATGIIRFRIGIVVAEWLVHCDADTEGEEELRAHLKRWLPDAMFISAEIIPDETVGR